MGIPKYIGNATSPITPPIFNVLPQSTPNDDCVFVAIFATSLLLSVLIIVVSITWDDECNYIYPNFTSNDIYVNESIGTVVKDVDISVLSTIRNTNPNNVVIGPLNINSFSNKFDTIKLVIQGKIDIMVIVETKLNNPYPISQFHIEGYATPFRRDRNKYGGGILINVREDIPCKLLDRHIFPDDIEGLFVELNFRKSKLLLLGTCHPPSQDDNYYFQTVGNDLEVYITKYEKYILAGDFKAEVSNLSNFLDMHGLYMKRHVTNLLKIPLV